MKTIKFRAWTENTWLTDTLKEKMIYDYQDTTLVEVFGFNSEELPVMQYTGLKDKNGKEIYEGDIVNRLCEMKHFEYEGIVKLIDGSYLIENLQGDDGDYLFNEHAELEVIGNIYEHSHLLEGK